MPLKQIIGFVVRDKTYYLKLIICVYWAFISPCVEVFVEAIIFTLYIIYGWI